MDRLLIEILENEETNLEMVGCKLKINALDFQSIADACPSLTAAIRQHVMVVCGICGSFLISSLVLYRLIEDLSRYTDAALHDEKNELYDLIDEVIAAINHSLIVKISATDEEWASFMTIGNPPLNPLYDHKGGFVYKDESGNPVKLSCEDTVFKFGNVCVSCNHLF